ncbi:uncharacterized protein LOC116679100 [Etheostoma spectabile]|uniref:uncharacterized protein LOC116679100 n=1 Tax=Etheostoma spectabile TaxID=54343 RepID=UPI0013AF7BAE|nr:uncharacterized protein LOC116679100 [Etheostoma spectabile]
MAEASFRVSEDQFQCSICLNVFTDPVSTSCGHNFCRKCITEHWNTTDQYLCPLCKKVFEKKTELHVNTFISEMVAQFRQSAQQKASSSSSEQQGSKPGEVPCDVCTGTKLKALKSCLVCLVSYCEAHLEPHLTTSGLKKHQLIDPVENLEGRMCTKHDKPLELFCKTDQTCVCMLCTVLDHKMHDVVTLKEGYKEKKAELEAEIQQMIQKRRLKVQEIKQSVELSEEDADREIAEGVQVFTSLKESVERGLNELINTIKEKQKTREKQAEAFITELEQEISELMKRSTEVEQLSRSEDHFHLLQRVQSLNTNHPPPTKDWTDVSIHPSSYEGTMVRAVAQLEETLSKEMKKLVESELKRVQQYAVDVTLDPDTAHPNLILSHGRKPVRVGDVWKNLPDNPERFSDCPCVLGKQSFSSGRFYFEVQVEGKTGWDLGVARESIKRKGPITASPEDGNWTILLRNTNEDKAAAGPSVLLSLKSPPQKVGVFVDYEEGLVSFYDVDAAALIYSFTGCSFTGKLLPFFSPGLNDGGKNSDKIQRKRFKKLINPILSYIAPSCGRSVSGSYYTLNRTNWPTWTPQHNHRLQERRAPSGLSTPKAFCLGNTTNSSRWLPLHPLPQWGRLCTSSRASHLPTGAFRRRTGQVSGVLLQSLTQAQAGSRQRSGLLRWIWTLAADSGWNEEALRGVFINGLTEVIKDELAVRDEPDSLDKLVSLAIKLDNRLRERRRERGGPPRFTRRTTAPDRLRRPSSPSLPASSPDYAFGEPAEETMELGRARLSPAERRHRIQAGACLYCGDPSHHVVACPSRPKDKARQRNLSRPEREAMERYIGESLSAGIIRPSSSPVGAGFFFVEKKDKTLRPCLQRLLENKLYVKAEKCSFHQESVPFWDLSSRVDKWRQTRRKPRQSPAGLRPRHHPDSALQFVVEVDASSSGVGAVLSQRSTSDQKLHPCAFMSKKLSPAEQNYDVGNRELLAVKLALDEWRHWLEGAEQPFVECQTDALSRVFDCAEDSSAPESVLPSSCVVAAVSWEIESLVKAALATDPGPGDGPLTDSSFHNLCELRYFTEADVRSYVAACSVCAGVRPPPSACWTAATPLGPKRPWSHVALDFVTGLPLSEGATVSLSSGFHPQSNGQTERANQDLEASLRCVAAQDPTTWASHLPWVEHAHNSLTTSATGLSPSRWPWAINRLCSRPREGLGGTLGAGAPTSLPPGVDEAREALLRTTERTKEVADRHRAPAPQYQPGQQVWLSSQNIPLRTESRKLSPRFLGPFAIDAVISPTAVRLKLPAAMRVHPTFHVSQVKPIFNRENNDLLRVHGWQRFTNRNLCKYTFIREMAAQFRQSAQQKASSSSSEQQVSKPGEVPCDVCTGTKLKAELGKTEAEIQQMIKERKKRIRSIKRRTNYSRKNAEVEIRDGFEAFTALIEIVEKTMNNLIDTIQERQNAIEEQAKAFITELEQEISELMKRSTEVEQLSRSEDHLHFLQGIQSMKAVPPTKDWTVVKVCPQSYMGTVVRALAQLEEEQSEAVKILFNLELQGVQQYAVNVSLDPETAHPQLILSQDGKQVYHGGDVKKTLPDKPERFSNCLCVFGKQSFSEQSTSLGRFYFEVEVKEKTKWTLGVASESINRKENIKLSPEDGYWTVRLRNENKYQANAARTVLLSLKSRPQKVGVFVDCLEGLVCFYDVDAPALIYSFTGCSFTEKVYPYLCPCPNDGGKNSAPLILSPVNCI